METERKDGSKPNQSRSERRRIEPDTDPNGTLSSILGFILVNLPERESLLELAQNGQSVSRRIVNENWSFSVRKSKKTNGEPMLFLLMQTKDSVDQSTTYGISTDPNIETVDGMAFGPTNKEILIGMDPFSFAGTIKILKEKPKKTSHTGIGKQVPTPEAQQIRNKPHKHTA